MKKFALVIVAALISMTAFAQQGDKAVGARLVYGSEIEKLGLGIVGQYGITNEVRGDASLFYYPDSDFSAFEFNANAHYLLGNDSVTFYPFAGLNITNIKHVATKPGLNVGCGIEFPLTDKLVFAAEAKYIIAKKGFAQFVIGGGLNFRF